jgi:nucleotide-binding universal stress UspA family protein
MNLKEPVRHILVAHDFAADSEAALDYAVALAKPLGARITVLHTYEFPSMGMPEMPVMAADWIKQIGTVAQQQLGRVVDRVKNTGVPVTSELRQGAVWREVEAAAKERHVDLVVVGSHGRRGLPRALLGSVAEKIVRTAPCPVLVVRGGGHEG